MDITTLNEIAAIGIKHGFAVIIFDPINNYLSTVDDAREPEPEPNCLDMTFEAELSALINRYSMENGSNTPDFILASAITDFLDVLAMVIGAREKWYSRGELAGGEDAIPAEPDLSRTDYGKAFNYRADKLLEQVRLFTETMASQTMRTDLAPDLTAARNKDFVAQTEPNELYDEAYRNFLDQCKKESFRQADLEAIRRRTRDFVAEGTETLDKVFGRLKSSTERGHADEFAAAFHADQRRRFECKHGISFSHGCRACESGHS